MKWSKSLWKSIHELAHESDKEPKTTDFKKPYAEFLTAVSKVLPCKHCKEHMKVYISKHPIKRPFFDWSVRFHNAINIKNDKPSISVKDARAMLYDEDKEKQSERYRRIILITGLVSILLLLAAVLFFSFKR